MGLDNDIRRDTPTLTSHHERRKWQKKQRRNTSERRETLEKYGVMHIKRKMVQ